MTRRWPRTVLLFGGLGVGLVSGMLVLDYALNSDNTEIANRSAYADRARIYVFALTAVLAVTIAAGLRATAQRRELLTDVGVAGVLTGLLTAFILSRELALLGDQNTAAIWVPTAGLLLVAAVGTLATARAESDDDTGRAFGRVAIACAALTILLTVAAYSGGDCDSDADRSDLLLLLISVPAGITASVMGLLALAKRLWIAALLSIPTVGVVLISAFADACLS